MGTIVSHAGGRGSCVVAGELRSQGPNTMVEPPPEVLCTGWYRSQKGVSVVAFRLDVWPPLQLLRSTS